MQVNRSVGHAAPETLASKLLFVFLLFVTVAATVIYGAVDSAAIGLLAAAAALIVLLWIADAFGRGSLVVSKNLLQLPMIALIMIGIIQLLPFAGAQLDPVLTGIELNRSLSMDPWATRSFAVRLIAILVFFAAALVFASSDTRTKKLVITLVVFGTAMAFFGIIQRLAQPEAIYGLRPTPQAIPFGSYVNQHHFAALMEMTVGLTLGLALGDGVKRDRKLLLWIAVVIMSLALIFTGSRGGMLSFTGVLVFVAAGTFIFRRRSNAGSKNTETANSDRKLAAVAGAVAIVLVFLGLIAFLGAGEGLLRGIAGDPGSDPTSGRLHFWAIALKIFGANPILGAGLDAFGAAFPKYDTWNGMFRIEQAHNDYLQMLADAGILGFACLVAFVVFFFRTGIRSISRMQHRFDGSAAIGAMAGCFGILIHSFVDFPLRTPANSLVFVLLLVVLTRKSEPDMRNGETT